MANADPPPKKNTITGVATALWVFFPASSVGTLIGHCSLFVLTKDL